MASTSGETLEKLEDMIVRAAEMTAAHVQAAKAAIGSVIFGQDTVIERALITVLSGGHALLVGVPGLAKTRLVDTMGTALGLDARRAHDHIFQLFQGFAACRRHSSFSFRRRPNFGSLKRMQQMHQRTFCCANWGESASLHRQAYAIFPACGGSVTKARTGLIT